MSAFFASSELVARIERAESELVRTGTEAARRRDTQGRALAVALGGGVAAWAGDGSPLNKVAGLGFGPLPRDEEFAAIEFAFDCRATPVRVELASLAEPELADRLMRRGYRFVGFENVLGLPLADAPPPAMPPGVEVLPGKPGDFGAWLDVVVTGFAHPDAQGVPSDEEFPREVLERVMTDLAGSAGFSVYVARRNGDTAGGAALRLDQGIAQLCGAATLPAHRRHGVQTALLLARLDLARACGCDIAVVTTQPGSKSQQNVQKQGFHLLYTRAILVRG